MNFTPDDNISMTRFRMLGPNKAKAQEPEPEPESDEEIEVEYNV